MCHGARKIFFADTNNFWLSSCLGSEHTPVKEDNNTFAIKIIALNLRIPAKLAMVLTLQIQGFLMVGKNGGHWKEH